MPIEYIDKVGELAKKHGLKLHIDGARIFNASVVSIVTFLYIIFFLYVFLELFNSNAKCSEVYEFIFLNFV